MASSTVRQVSTGPEEPAIASHRDPDRDAVYAAEEHVYSWLAAATPEQPRITVDGEEFTPEVEPRFTDPAAVATYVDQVLDHLRHTDRHYGGREQLPVTVRSRRGHRLASYEPLTLTIAVPSSEVGGRWALRGLVVLHELAHHLDGGPEDEPAHGPSFRATYLRLLEDIGQPVNAQLLHLAFDTEGLTAVGHETGGDTIARIAKLLRQAERASGEHERDAFLTKAQGLATRHSIALAVARAHTAKEERREALISQTCRIGEPGKRGLARYVLLLLNIAHANDVRCTIYHDSTGVTLHGFESDVAVTRAIYESLLVQMVASCERYLAERPEEHVEAWDNRRRRWVVRRVATITARLEFYRAFAGRIRQRLEAAKSDALDAVAADPVAATSDETALAIRQKELDIHDYFQEILDKNNIRGTWRGNRNSSADAPHAAGEGARAADRANLGGERALGLR